MKKSLVRCCIVLLTVVCVACCVLTGCQLNASDRNEITYGAKTKAQYADGNVPLTDLAADYKGEATDSEGNLNAPFDVVYPQHFASGAYPYDKTAALLKFAKGYDGTVTRDLAACGFTSVAKVSTNADGSEWYRAEISDKTTVEIAVQKARSLKHVLMADYDYIYQSQSVDQSASDEGTTTTTSDGTTTDSLIDDVLDNIQVRDQWYLTACSIQRAWRFLKANNIPAGGLPSVTVAVIDTGVDYNHPDLKANMWVNDGEIAGNGIDDDGDGYVDDIHGCSTVSDDRFHSGDPMDDHGHGTHVAGIIAAANNRVGIVGVAYNAKIMAIKAGQATGVFLQSDIAEAIVYAYTHGADVINMSFGGSACSIAVQDALQQAYTTSTLVAAAGNDGKPNEATDYFQLWGDYLPSYPAALSYVVGVMSVNAFSVESSFTNWDAKVHNSVEYEVYAPGEAMLSTLPNNRYGKLNGTSMAAPVVSGIAALLRSYYTDRDMYPSKFISAQICATSGDVATCFNPTLHTVEGKLHNIPMITNAYDALTKLPHPNITSFEYYLFDDKDFAIENDGDGVVDAGETIHMALVLRNQWGMSKDTVVKINANSGVTEGIEIPNKYIEFITDEVNYGSVGTYSTKDFLVRDTNGAITGVELPFVFKISRDCPNDYIIPINIVITAGNALDENDQNEYKWIASLSFAVRNGVVLPSQITEDMTLTSDNYYIIPNSTVIAEGATVTVEPGTKIQFWSNDPSDPYADQYIAYLQVEGKFITNGTLENPVELFPSELMDRYCVSVAGNVYLNYTNITNAVVSLKKADHCVFKQNVVGAILCKSMALNKIEDRKYNYWLENNGFYIQNALNCVFYKLGGDGDTTAAGYYFYVPNIKGNFEKCTFVDCQVQLPISNTYDCVFMGNNMLDYQGTNIVTSNHGDLSDLYRTDIAKNTVLSKDGEYTYVTVCGSYDGNQFDKFFSMLNGEMSCIETAEEAEYMYENGVFGYVGYSGGANWNNGKALSDFWKIMELNQPYKFAYFGDTDYSSTPYTLRMCSYGSSHIYEVPNIERGQKWSVEEIQQLYNSYVNATWNSLKFEGNAIINNLNDSNVEHWFRIISRGFMDSKYKIGIAGNYWGTTDIYLIEKQIVDYDDYKNLTDIVSSGFLTTAPSNTFPFVVDAYVLNSKGERARTVSNETCTFVVEFNRDMDTTIPLRFRFGSSMPYAEYEVGGSYVTPRKWVGTYTLRTTIENGNQFFNIDNARAADDHFLRLYETKGRFGFEIDTTAAQAMIMQGEATETGVQLTWQQDDFDTLLGYNVYRSDKEDGLYTRLNSYVLAADENAFFDNTVEPGKLYYYNFTVVKTDMQESTPSGKIVIRAMDTMAPNVYHSPVRTAYTGKNLIVSATITDNLQVSGARLYYRIKDGEWKSVAMYNNNSRYYGIVGAEYITLDGLEYYIDATDGVTHTYSGTAETPYAVTVKLAVDANSLGDVDGDGVITNKDALMLMQAANDLLNLTEEQFMRADINGDGELSAAEAMRILQYVSGKVTTIVA